MADLKVVPRTEVNVRIVPICAWGPGPEKLIILCVDGIMDRVLSYDGARKLPAMASDTYRRTSQDDASTKAVTLGHLQWQEYPGASAAHQSLVARYQPGPQGRIGHLVLANGKTWPTPQS